ncbi:MAG: glycosyltransferase family 4 protein [Pseudomonadota bacterium]
MTSNLLLGQEYEPWIGRATRRQFFDLGWCLSKYHNFDADYLCDYFFNRKSFDGDDWLDPSANFDTRAYLQAYPDVLAFPAHPLCHFLKFGDVESRFSFPQLVQPAAMDAPDIWMESHRLDYTGAPMASWDLASLLKAAGVSVHVGSPFPGVLEVDFETLGSKTTVHGLSILRAHSAEGYEAILNHAETCLKTARPKVLHASSSHSAHWVLAAQKLGIPSVFVIHEPDPKIETILHSTRIRDLVQAAFDAAGSVVFVAKPAIEAWAAEFTIETKKLALIEKPAPVLPMELKAAKRDPDPSQRLTILSVGTVSPRKDQNSMIEACLRLGKDGFGKMMELIIVGFGKDDYSKELKAKAKTLRDFGVKLHLVSQSETFEERQKVFRFFKKADVFVMTSRAETLPRTIAEAYQFHVPVIAPDSAGIGEMVQDGQTGFLYGLGDVEQLAALLKPDADRKDVFAKLRKNMSTSKILPTAQASTQAYLDEYKKLWG